MGNRVAPTVDGTPTRILLSMRLMDVSGDLYSESIYLPAGTLDADIEAIVAAYQSATQATLYQVSVAAEYVGVPSVLDADSGTRDSVADGLNLLFRNPTLGISYTMRIVAPEPALFVGNGDVPDTSSAEFTTVIGLIEAAKTDYLWTSVQYTERRERSNNPRISS